MANLTLVQRGGHKYFLVHDSTGRIFCAFTEKEFVESRKRLRDWQNSTPYDLGRRIESYN